MRTPRSSRGLGAELFSTACLARREGGEPQHAGEGTNNRITGRKGNELTGMAGLIKGRIVVSDAREMTQRTQSSRLGAARGLPILLETYRTDGPAGAALFPRPGAAQGEKADRDSESRVDSRRPLHDLRTAHQHIPTGSPEGNDTPAPGGRADADEFQQLLDPRTSGGLRAPLHEGEDAHNHCRPPPGPHGKPARRVPPSAPVPHLPGCAGHCVTGRTSSR
jgi:hypothetical protein